MKHYSFKSVGTDGLSKDVDQLMYVLKEKLKIENESMIYYNIRLAIWEIFCNIIEHSIENKAKEINVTMVWNAKALKIEIEDCGCGFNWKEKLPETPPDITQIGGRGLLLVDQICDEFCFDSDGKVATLVFTF